jgi:hypothetical protein
MVFLKVPSPLALVVGGSWKGHLAGGRLPSPSWPSNPQFILSSHQKTYAMLLLLSSGANRAPSDDAVSSIGMVVTEVSDL